MKNLVLYEGFLKTLGKNVSIETIRNFEDFKSGIRVFCAAPFNELLTDEDCKKEYELYEDNGIAFGAYIDDELLGLNCIYNAVDKKHSIGFIDEDKVAYYAGLATKNIYIDGKKVRRSGLGKLLVKTTEDYIEESKKYDYAFARIRTLDSESEGIFYLNGFRDAYDDKGNLILDSVTYQRNNTNKEETDIRKYMVKTLNPNGNGWYRK